MQLLITSLRLSDIPQVITLLPYFFSIYSYLSLCYRALHLTFSLHHFFFQWLFSVKSFSLFSHCSNSLALNEVKYSLVTLYTVFVAVSKQGTSCSVMVLDVRIDGNSRWTDSRWQMDSSCCVLAVQCRGTDRLSAATLKPTRQFKRESAYIKTSYQKFEMRSVTAVRINVFDFGNVYIHSKLVSSCRLLQLHCQK